MQSFMGKSAKSASRLRHGTDRSFICTWRVILTEDHRVGGGPKAVFWRLGRDVSDSYIDYLIRVNHGALIKGELSDGWLDCPCDGPVTPQVHYYGWVSWNDVAQELGFTNMLLARVVSAARLVFWHWMQPAVYTFAFWAYSDIMDYWQIWFAVGVLIREGTYILQSLLALCVCPGVLLFSTKRSSWDDLALYACSPQMVLQLVLQGHFDNDVPGGRNLRRCGYTFKCFLVWLNIPSALGDICAPIALVLGILHGKMWAPLAIGYGLAALGILNFTVVHLGYQKFWRDSALREYLADQPEPSFLSAVSSVGSGHLHAAHPQS